MIRMRAAAPPRRLQQQQQQQQQQLQMQPQHHAALFFLAVILIAYLIGRVVSADASAPELHTAYTLILLLLGASAFL